MTNEKLSALLRATAHAIDVWESGRVLERRIDPSERIRLAQQIEACEDALADAWLDLDSQAVKETYASHTDMVSILAGAFARTSTA